MIQKLGFSTNDRLVVINADDLGATRSANLAIARMFRSHAITSASIMVPADAAREAARLCATENTMHVGIHITLTSDKNRPYKPISNPRTVPSLTDEFGYFYHEVSDFEMNADPEEVRIEVDAQIRTAISLGIDPTHLDSHAGSVLGLHRDRDFLEVIFGLCQQYALPFGLPTRILEHPGFSSEQNIRFRQRIQLANRLGVQMIDDIAGLPYDYVSDEGYEGAKKELIKQLHRLKPGITQTTTHPALASDGLHDRPAYSDQREWEFRLYNDPDVREAIKNANVKLISWKDIRDRQRNDKRSV